MRRLKDLVLIAADNLDGCNWYPQATQQIQQVSRSEQWCPDRFACVLALLSPRCAVRRNVRNALEYIAYGRLLGNTMQSLQQSLAHYESTGNIRGQKVSAFRLALSGDDTAVVLDVHMARVLRVEQRLFTRADVRSKCNRLVSRVADRLGISPRETQASLWCGQKRLMGETVEPYPIALEYSNWLAHNRSFPSTGPIRRLGNTDGLHQTSLLFGG